MNIYLRPNLNGLFEVNSNVFIAIEILNILAYSLKTQRQFLVWWQWSLSGDDHVQSFAISEFDTCAIGMTLIGKKSLAIHGADVKENLIAFLHFTFITRTFPWKMLLII